MPHNTKKSRSIRHLYARDQGFNPNYAIADASTGLRAGYKLIWQDKPRHGDVFHILHQCEGSAHVPGRVAHGCRVPMPPGPMGR